MAENVITSVERALHLLSVLASQPNCGLSALARQTGMNKSRVYRLLCTLEKHHFVQRSAEPVVYQLGHQLLVLGVSAASQIDLVSIAEPVVEQLGLRFDENIQVRIRDGTESVQILRRLSHQPLQVHSSAGNRRSLGMGASGRLLLAYAPSEIQQRVLQQYPDLLINSQQIRRQAFSKTEGELTSGIFSFAAAIFNTEGHCVASLSLSAPRIRIDEHTEQAISVAIQCAAHDISVSLGYRSPPKFNESKV